MPFFSQINPPNLLGSLRAGREPEIHWLGISPRVGDRMNRPSLDAPEAGKFRAIIASAFRAAKALQDREGAADPAQTLDGPEPVEVGGEVVAVCFKARTNS